MYGATCVRAQHNNTQAKHASHTQTFMLRRTLCVFFLGAVVVGARSVVHARRETALRTPNNNSITNTHTHTLNVYTLLTYVRARRCGGSSPLCVCECEARATAHTRVWLSLWSCAHARVCLQCVYTSARARSALRCVCVYGKSTATKRPDVCSAARTL